MRESPRLRRLRSDQRAMEQLRAESEILDYTAPGPLFGGPPEVYGLRFHGVGLWRPDGAQDVLMREGHEIVIRLGASYPRMMPELIWKTPIFHPNISANGVVCLGGYSTHWVPSLQLDELCTMLWDMIRYANYDVDSPYNRAAAQWAKEQRQYRLPVDHRPLREVVDATPARDSAVSAAEAELLAPMWQAPDDVLRLEPLDGSTRQSADIVFVSDEVVDAEIVSAAARDFEDAEILFIE